MNARGQYGRPHIAIAGPLFHTVSDRDKLVEETDTSFSRLINELYLSAGGQ